MTKWIALLWAVSLSSASAQEPSHPFELVSDHCQGKQCLLLWAYQGSEAPTAEQLLSLYREGERYGKGPITLEENIVRRTLLLRVEREIPLQALGEAGAPCSQGECAP